MQSQEIPIVSLDTKIVENKNHYSQPILTNEIEGINLEHGVVNAEHSLVDYFQEGYRTIYLFVKGSGSILAKDASYDLVSETIFLPNAAQNITIKAADDGALHYLKIVCKLSAQDHLDLQALPTTNTGHVYHAKFSDCQSYSEAIKSPNTVSRTILSNEYIPRVAMGTVQTKGPDKVAAHEHPMLEQLFLGLSGNNCTVYADDKKMDFPQYSVLHIPLGSSHSVSVEENESLYYVWMDFFLDKQGEQWLETHKIDD